MSGQNPTLKKAMLRALEQSLGVVTTAAKKVGLNRSTHYEWIKTDEAYKAAVEDIENIAIDFAESQLHQQINNNNTTATIFFLKTKGKKRGYVETTIIKTQDSDLEGMTDEELDAEIKRLQQLND